MHVYFSSQSAIVFETPASSSTVPQQVSVSWPSSNHLNSFTSDSFTYRPNSTVDASSLPQQVLTFRRLLLFFILLLIIICKRMLRYYYLSAWFVLRF
jgi:hypothetical protein